MSRFDSTPPANGSSTRIELPQQAYGPSFWIAYASNTLLMMAVSLVFRYADFIDYLGGGEIDLGLIVGVGMIGAVAMRIFQGVGIDRLGPRHVWILSLAMFAVSLIAHLAITRPDGWAIYLVRIVMTTGIAGSFGASLTYVSLRAPQQRMAEMIGTMGTSGFVGQAFGPMLGDWLFATAEPGRVHIESMFLWAAGITLVALLLAAIATHGQVRRRRKPQPPIWALLRRYHPGGFLLVGAAMGIGIGLPHSFLRMYCLEVGISGIKTFFLTYSVVAFAVRLATRHFPARYGNRRMIYWGLASLAASMVAYLPAQTETALILPAIFGGIAHAFLFPSVVAGGSSFFPTRYRGLGNTLMLAMFDVGNLIGQPAVGYTLAFAKAAGLPAYPTMFVLLAIGLVAVGVAFALWPDPRRKRAPRSNSRQDTHRAEAHQIAAACEESV